VAGLRLLDTLAHASWQRPFAHLQPSQQDHVLMMVQDTPHVTVQRAFGDLVELTLEVCLSAPVHGGNPSALGWRHIGFTPHALSVSCAPPALCRHVS
jgi:hypothetical protein